MSSNSGNMKRPHIRFRHTIPVERNYNIIDIDYIKDRLNDKTILLDILPERTTQQRETPRQQEIRLLYDHLTLERVIDTVNNSIGLLVVDDNY